MCPRYPHRPSTYVVYDYRGSTIIDKKEEKVQSCKHLATGVLLPTCVRNQVGG